MKGGLLEVLLVNAEGIDRTHIFGRPTFHVIIECGTQICRSKTSEGHHDDVCWNEKFTFELPSSELEKLNYLKLTIIDEEHFGNGGFVGETVIYLKGIIVEGSYQGYIELLPAPYNVVLEDDTYRGQIKIGLKFIPDIDQPTKITEPISEGSATGGSICKAILNICRLQWWRFFISCRKSTSAEATKQD